MQQKHGNNSYVSITRIFLSQCVDHSISLAFGLFLFFVALSLLQSPALENLSLVGPSFWIAFFATLFASSLLQRFFSVLMFGSSFGNLCFHLRPQSGVENRAFWIGQIFESLQVAIPALWLLDLLTRSQGSRFQGIRYSFNF